ncbi:G-protein coupled receptor Mth2-like [Musca autumnalis]|uniref:G-protein coupled receptor Mth2-like n=1 Tax=Musca autumnalis TaxID=221902 RepID=UPI003CF7178B
MTRTIVLSVLLISTTIAIQTDQEKCPFKDTVDLTNQTLLANGSYIYQNILIPKENVSLYQYHLEFLDKKYRTKGHPRGCACGPKLSGRYCLKLCCEHGKFYNQTSLSCEKIPNNRNVSDELEVRMVNDKLYKSVNLFENFIMQVGLPCAKPQVLSDALEEWDILENGILEIYSAAAKLDTVSYCITSIWNETTNVNIFKPVSCPMKSEAGFTTLLNTYGMLLSVLFLIPTIVVHLLLKELREKKIFISYLIALTVGYSTLTLINVSHARFDTIGCSLIGYIGYYFLMAAFLWISVLCFDIWYTFNSNAYNSARRFKIYSLYAWGLSGLMTGVVIWSQLSDYVDEIYKPGIGFEMCWLNTSKWSAVIYLYGPNTIILIFSLITCIYVMKIMHRCASDRIDEKEKRTQNIFRERIVLLLRLFILMGITWFMDILSFCLRNYPEIDRFFILTDFCNAVQGVLIFILFVMRRKVMLLLKARFQKKSLEDNVDNSFQFHTTSFSTKI